MPFGFDIPPNTGNPAETLFQAKITLNFNDLKEAGPLPPESTSLVIESLDMRSSYFILLQTASSCNFHLFTQILSSGTMQKKTEPN